jgi:hypothetical protein
VGLVDLSPSERRARIEALSSRLDSGVAPRLAVLAKRLGAGDTVSAAF